MVELKNLLCIGPLCKPAVLAPSSFWTCLTYFIHFFARKGWFFSLIQSQWRSTKKSSLQIFKKMLPCKCLLKKGEQQNFQYIKGFEARYSKKSATAKHHSKSKSSYATIISENLVIGNLENMAEVVAKRTVRKMKGEDTLKDTFNKKK